MKTLADVIPYYHAPSESKKKIQAIANSFETRIKGKRGAPEKREQFYASVAKLLSIYAPKSFPLPRAARLYAWRKKQALALADCAGTYFDEHGGHRGDSLNTYYIDYVEPKNSAAAPYLDMGGEGLALVGVNRTRVYAKSVTSVYLVGKNEAGTYFAHCVPEKCPDITEALKWIWNGRQDDIITRQGDIALIQSSRRNLPRLPHGHRIEGEMIVHGTHPPIRVPGKREAIIIAKRAVVKASEGTRD